MVEVALQSADLEPFLERANGERAPGPIRVLCVGRLVPDKNIETLIDAFAAAGFADGEAELMVAGSGPLEARLSAAAERSGAAVRMVGYVPPDELPALYAQADVLALVSTYEPFGATMREGAAAGLALLCTRRAGAAGDVAVEGENALLVDPRDPAGIADALARLVRDSELRGRLAATSLEVSARHPLEADAEAWERAVLGASRGAAEPAQQGRHDLVRHDPLDRLRAVGLEHGRGPLAVGVGVVLVHREGGAQRAGQAARLESRAPREPGRARAPGRAPRRARRRERSRPGRRRRAPRAAPGRSPPSVRRPRRPAPRAVPRETRAAGRFPRNSAFSGTGVPVRARCASAGSRSTPNTRRRASGIRAAAQAAQTMSSPLAFTSGV